MNYITFHDVSKTYTHPHQEVIKNFNLEIKKGEFIVIVGPSGSGKSTLLELICGFEALTSGTISIDGTMINDVLPKNRDVAMVFQNYALLPHLTTYENIAFGMKIRKCSKKEIEEKVQWAAKILKLEDYLHALPKNLSGGQRQRVAIARAIVREPKLFLMDEPLSNLDAKLRDSTATEITNLHRRLNATTIYVTHDQTEALTMADRMVILHEGKIQQIGTPIEIYTKPKNLFVATFIGKPQMNLFDFMIKNEEALLLNDVTLHLGEYLNSLLPTEDYLLAIRPEHIKETNDKNGIKTTIKKVEYMGSDQILHLAKGEELITMKCYNSQEYKEGQALHITFDLHHAHVFNKNTQERIEPSYEKN